MSGDRLNVLLISSDQHNPRFLGVAGHPDVRTPNLDELARRGALFTSAYCTSPICVPSRASMVTGRYVHETGHWDNAAPYTGDPESWGHALTRAGYQVTTIGKLHYRDTGDDTGFPDQRLPMHVHRGGDLRGVALRPDGKVPEREGRSQALIDVGAGESDYTRYDRAITDSAVQFLEHPPDEPWALTASLVAPHFPLIAPAEFHSLYEASELSLPLQDAAAWDHPAVTTFKTAFGLSEPFSEHEQRAALHAYTALCTFLDSRIGLILDALDRSGHSERTLVIYTSDHGENAGAHGMWFKHLMTEESAGVPLIVAGPSVRAGVVVDSPVSLVDLYPTVLEAAGLEWDASMPGVALGETVRSPQPNRAVLSEYHANGSTSASFMIRDGRYKYIEYVGERPQLFDLEADPGETTDLAGEPEFQEVVSACALRLRQFCDPIAVDRDAKADQARRVERAGGIESAFRVEIPFTPVPSGR